jgi:glucan phosphorylase
MKFAGTLIEDLMATVERAEQKAQSHAAYRVENMVVEHMLIEPWFTSTQDNTDYDSKFLGVA